MVLVVLEVQEPLAEQELQVTQVLLEVLVELDPQEELVQLEALVLLETQEQPVYSLYFLCFNFLMFMILM